MTAASDTIAPDFYTVGRQTVFVDAPRLSERLGAEVTLAAETFQCTGSFKFRAAYHVAATVPQRELLVASSGNFGQALAYACRLLGKRCTVVLPQSSARVKIDAVRGFGATVDLIDTTIVSRAARVAELAGQYPNAYVASAYDVEGVRLLFELANLKAEPTGALAIAALLEVPERWREGRVCCVVTGGNVDPALYAKILVRSPGFM